MLCTFVEEVTMAENKQLSSTEPELSSTQPESDSDQAIGVYHHTHVFRSRSDWTSESSGSSDSDGLFGPENVFGLNYKPFRRSRRVKGKPLENRFHWVSTPIRRRNIRQPHFALGTDESADDEAEESEDDWGPSFAEYEMKGEDNWGYTQKLVADNGTTQTYKTYVSVNDGPWVPYVAPRRMAAVRTRCLSETDVGYVSDHKISPVKDKLNLIDVKRFALTGKISEMKTHMREHAAESVVRAGKRPRLFTVDVELYEAMKERSKSLESELDKVNRRFDTATAELAQAESEEQVRLLQLRRAGIAKGFDHFTGGIHLSSQSGSVKSVF
jgi:hypothetical protein